MSMAMIGMPGLVIARGDGRRHRLVGLELDHEIDALANQVLGVAERDLRLVAVVDDDQLDLLALGGAQRARRALRAGRSCPAPCAA